MNTRPGRRFFLFGSFARPKVVPRSGEGPLLFHGGTTRATSTLARIIQRASSALNVTELLLRLKEGTGTGDLSTVPLRVRRDVGTAATEKCADHFHSVWMWLGRWVVLALLRCASPYTVDPHPRSSRVRLLSTDAATQR